ncbi:MAG: glutaredoxin 3 [Gammaproteobacteria bacterium]|nr:MAG: glutaredoxin 3 [Gammaproteobacteria bacterium]
MSTIKMYSSNLCGYCRAAHRLLSKKGVDNYETIIVDGDYALRAHMIQISGRHTVPQIFIGERHIGGYTDLAALDAAGELDELLKEF